eukprot:TRINITY_DN86399_c0_g1_i1.p1 TRINITY_DN86399_c0_g1~~TRINITY_DN86399_c0_g1_i1.p1  ORF type:complete len:305 (-),score=87.83 TRINITY_DN86399_c0_g1_i1:88-954(-)
MPSSCAAPLARRLCRRRGPVRLLVGVAALALAGFTTVCRRPATAVVQAVTEGAEVPAGLLGSLRSALSQVAALQAAVESGGGQVVHGFGQKAADILARLPQQSPEALAAVDGSLEALFLRQVAVLRQQVAARFEMAKDLDAEAQADSEFVSVAQDLVRPGSDWSYEQERTALRRWLHGAYERDAALVEEQAQAARMQQAVIDVISKLQTKMELLMQKAQGLGKGSSPWVLSTSYRVPNTPLQLVGKYEQGRANVELNLTPAKDPSKSDSSLADSLGPATFGVSFNVGI